MSRIPDSIRKTFLDLETGFPYKAKIPKTRLLYVIMVYDFPIL